MKKRVLRNIEVLCLILMITVISSSLNRITPNQKHAEIIFSPPQNESIGVPVETTMEPFLDQYLNAESSGESIEIVEYNVKTGVEETYNVNFDEIHSVGTQIEPYAGNFYHRLMEQKVQEGSFSEALSSSSTLGPEELTLVNDTTIYPWSAVVKVISTINDTHSAWCSGTLIDSNHVLTAGHCIYDITDGGWRSDVYVIPGKNGTGNSLMEEPFGRAYATHLRSTKGWTQNPSPKNDWALITLDRDIGDETGWLGVKTLPLDHNNYTDMVYTAGYPAETKSGYYMYNNSGSSGWVDEYNHYYTFYGEGGQSGSGVWTYQNASPYIISIYAWSTPMGTRITQEKFDILNLWLEQDASTEPQVDFEVLGSNNILKALNYIKTVNTFFTAFPIATQVQNHGNIGADKVTLGYYLSEDDIISAEDYLIAEKTIRNLQAFELRNVEKRVRIPLGIPPGSYELGWMIDPNNEIDEYFEDNNFFVCGIRLYVQNTFLDPILTDPLWLSLIITGIVLVIAAPAVIVVVVLVKKRRKLPK
ncbi:MAG: trypsin-like serine protease [Candidatus Lokiarchaeota archaeon]|nr:trypsin-like serine protease [Candidatus Lokiarchaeota archaeon]